MNRLSQLQAKKMMKELEYLNSELDWKNELISDADGKFMNNVNDFLDQNPELKHEFDKVMDRRMAETVRIATERANSCSDYAETEKVQTHEKKESNPKVKSMFREVVKMTHPDKIDDPRMNEMYIDACRFYEQDDLFSFYTLCGKLGMEYEVDECDLEELERHIDSVREKIGMIEAATTWVWYNAEDERFKKDIVLRYVMAQIR